MDRITEVTRECLDAVIEVRRADDQGLPPPEKLRGELNACVKRLLAGAARAGFDRDEVDDIAYAVVALADEVVAARSEALTQYWAGHSLQLEHFRVANAGEQFFARLENLRKDPVRRREALQVYALALHLGFQGRYRARGGEGELLRVTEEVQRDLARGRKRDGEVLSPHGERPEDGRPEAAGRRTALWVAAASVALVLALYTGLRLSLGWSASGVLERIDAVTQPRART